MKSKTDYEVPSYPNHLTKDERGAVFEKAARDYVDSLGIENKGAPLTHGDFARHHAGYLIVAKWHKERIEALESVVAELRAAKAAKPRVRVPAWERQMTRISVTNEAKRLVAAGADPDRAAAVALVASVAAMALHSHDERRRNAGEVPEEVADLLDHQREMLREWADRSVRPLL